MLDVLIRFTLLPFVVLFILGFMYYDLWKIIKPKPETKS